MRKGIAVLTLLSLAALAGCSKAAPPPAPADVAGNKQPPVAAPAPGQVVRTVEAKIKPLTDSATLTASAFADSTHGWIALGKTIFATSDGGLRWSQLPDAPAHVQALDFPSPDRGWALTDKGLLSTADGGLTWASLAVKEPLSRMDFVDDTRGFAEASGQFLQTRDGGKTWAPANSPCDPEIAPRRVFSFLSPTTGWFICGGQPATSMQLKSLYHTTDGGKTWNLITAAAPNMDGGLPLTGHITGLYFRDPAKGWLALERGGVVQTTDGGRTWKALNMPQPDWSWAAPRPITDQDGFVISTAGSAPALLATKDGGKSWEQRFPSARPQFPVQFPTPTAGFAAGGPFSPDALLRSTDGGATWSRGSTIEGASEILDLSFPDATHGWAVVQTAGENGSFKRHVVSTTDGGKTWVKLQTAPDDNKGQYLWISFVDAQTGYLATGWGHLYISRDGGASFQPVSTVDVTGSHMRFLTADQGYRIIDQQLKITADGGKTWHDLLPDFRADSLQLLPGGILWAEARTCTSGPECKPVVLGSTDAGKTWTRFNLDLKEPGNLVFADASRGWLTDGTSTYATTDGGATWSALR